jgi:hypothetical protein
VADPLTAPLVVAALVLCVAGVAKLNAPATAARALESLGLPASGALVRFSAALEFALGALCLVRPSAVAEIALACVYGAFAAIAAALARSGAACGCFGETAQPTSRVQPILSAALALVSLGAALSSAHGVGWVLGRPAVQAVSLVIAIAGSAFATILIYTELPRAWGSWSAG